MWWREASRAELADSPATGATGDFRPPRLTMPRSEFRLLDLGWVGGDGG